MRRTIRRSWQTLVPFALFVTCILTNGCSCDPPAKALVSATSPCIVQDETVSAVKATGVTTIVPGALPASLLFPESGSAALDMLNVGEGAAAIAFLYAGKNLRDDGRGAGISWKGIDDSTLTATVVIPRYECTEEHGCPYKTKCFNSGPWDGGKPYECAVTDCGSSKCSACPSWLPETMKSLVFKSWCSYVCAVRLPPRDVVALGAVGIKKNGKP